MGRPFVVRAFSLAVERLERAGCNPGLVPVRGGRWRLSWVEPGASTLYAVGPGTLDEIGRSALMWLAEFQRARGDDSEAA